MIRIATILLLGMCLLFCNALYSQNLKAVPDLKTGKLSNGLTYYIYPNAYPKGEAVYRLFIKTGSVNEEENQRGLAHFLEHMAFNGTANFPGNTLVKFLESKGAKFGKDLNAHTSYNETVYKLKLPTTSKAIVDSTLMILADWANGISLDSLQIEEERGVIFSEWLSKTGAQRDVSNQFLQKLLNDSRYSQRVTIGDTGVIKNFRHEELKDYYQRWYRPDLMAVAVVGDVDPRLIEKSIKQHFGRIPGSKARLQNRFYGIDDYDSPRAKIIVNKNLKKNELNFIQLLPKLQAVNSSEAYSKYLTRSLVNRLIKSRFAALSFTNRSYENGSASISDFINTKGVLLASVELIPGKMEEGVKAFTNHLEQIYQYGFTSSEIERAKKVYDRQLQRRAESKTPVSSEELMNEIYSDFYAGNTFISRSEEYRQYKKFGHKIDSVSLLQYLKSIQNNDRTRYLYSTFNDTELIDQEHLLKTITAARLSKPERYKLNIRPIEELMSFEPEDGRIISEKKIPEIDATDMLLSNGARVIFRTSESSKNRVNFSAFKMGGLYTLDSAEYANGLFSTSVIPLSGVSSFTRDEVSQYLAGSSASVRFLIDKTRSGIVGGSSLEDIETMFQLLYLRSLAAKVDSSVFELTRNLSVENFRNRNKTGEAKFYEDLNHALVGKNYTTREMTDFIMLHEVDKNKLLPVYNKYFANANGYTYIFMSDTTLDFLKPYILKYIGSLPGVKNEAEFAYKFNGGTIRTDSLTITRKAGSSQRASVSLIFQATDLPKDYDRYQLQSTVLENIIKMKLTSLIREQLGLVYSIGVNSSSTLFPVPLSRSSITFSSLPENVELIVSNIKKVLSGIANGTLDYKQELENVQKNLIREMLLSKQKDSFWSTTIRNAVSQKSESYDFLTSYNESVENITVEELAGLIPKNFNADKMIKAILLPAGK